ncbi:exodeoxyribonuclease III [Actinoplanes utahensis]|uniref:Exodeoxyribonuclease III n=1 Tax=Actinoplanes utahensis TaxID=1869 RepID=A0A0A6UGN7_ACTUT|nr:exodeoxyribonuclease III [Actinoplanes utahensis]KHD74621.1 exodeoxyribonuclease III [Actinoplanes utahensis]GIF27728.1 exodeoxyribonuclease III [Actinoplanes utahensis]
MRFATWNVNSVKARLPRLLDWLAGTAPDVVCLQETKVAADGFPEKEVAELGYATAAYGQGRWNGVALLSRIGLDDVRHGFDGMPGYPEPEARAISAVCGGIRFTSVYVPNGRTPDDPHYTYKLRWLAALRDAVVADLAAGPLVVAGDYNVAPTDADVWDIGVFAGSTHVTPPERAALAALRDAGLTDVPARPLKGDRPFTYWDYRAGMFHQNKGMRIDLVYAGSDVAGRVGDAYVDREARKGKGPSDHAPVVVDLTDPVPDPVG